MKQEEFEQLYRAQWAELAADCEILEQGKSRLPEDVVATFPTLYGRVCSHLATAKSRCYSAGLIAELSALVRRGHRQLYAERTNPLQHAARFLAVDLPVAVRRQARLVWLATVLFYLPALLVGIWCYAEDDAVYRVMPAQAVASLEYSYDPETATPGRGPERQSDTDLMMFGYYIWNNVSIGFRTFASGIFFGIGSLFFLIYNGIHIGAAAGHLTGLGFVETFWSFVAGHGAFELTAIALSGAAGLMLGRGLLMPGQRRRRDALAAAARDSVPVISAAALFFLAAAFIEAFWSPSDFPALSKYVVASLLWAFVIAYLTLAGRGSSSGYR